VSATTQIVMMHGQAFTERLARQRDRHPVFSAASRGDPVMQDPCGWRSARAGAAAG
jgi:hypothetical protein